MSAAPDGAARPRALLVDTDAGVDDAQALVLLITLAAREGIHLGAITLVAGNVDVSKVRCGGKK